MISDFIRYSDTNQQTFTKTIMGFGLLLLVFLITLSLSAFFGQVISTGLGLHGRSELIALTICQDIIGFCEAALITGWIWKGKHLIASWLGCKEFSSPRVYCYILLMIIVMIPPMNEIIYFNEHISFPESMKGLEELFREWERTNAAAGELILSDYSISGLITGIALVGILTGISEELFFRGAMQSMLGKSYLGPHFGIWATAIIFSAIHFQFFGFIPRMLLGAFFGYLVYWSGSVWVSATAHALNNSIVVIFTWLAGRGIINKDFDMFGVISSGSGWESLAGIVLFTSMFISLHQFLRSNGKKG